MADNTFNFDLDAPAVPTLTLDPTPAEEEKAAPAQQEAAAPEQPQVNLTPEEQAMVDQFAEKIAVRFRLSEEDRRFLRGCALQGVHQGSGRSGRYDHQPDR